MAVGYRLLSSCLDSLRRHTVDCSLFAIYAKLVGLQIAESPVLGYVMGASWPP